MDCIHCGKPIDEDKKSTSEFCSRQCKDKHWQIIRKLDRKVERAVKVIMDLHQMKKGGEISKGEHKAAMSSIKHMIDREIK